MMWCLYFICILLALDHAEGYGLWSGYDINGTDQAMIEEWSSVSSLIETRVMDAPIITADLVPWRAVMQRLSRNESDLITVLGGSMTAGTGCNQSIAGRRLDPTECAWPSRLREWLTARYPVSSVRVMNLGRGMSFTAGIAIEGGVKSMLVRKGIRGSPDLALLDFGINDLAHASFDASRNNKNNLTDDLSKVVRQLQAMCTAVIICQSGTELVPYAEVAADQGIPSIRFQAVTRAPDLLSSFPSM